MVIFRFSAGERRSRRGSRGTSAALGLLLLAAMSAPTARADGHGGPPPQAALCASCHGPQGEGSPAGAPRLAGGDPDYLAHALTLFKARQRAGAAMQAVAQSLSEQQMHELAGYFAGQHPPALPAPPVPPAQREAGRLLAERGDGGEVEACFGCHGPDGRGQGTHAPRIAGQPQAFIIGRLHAFQERARAAPPKPHSMSEAASRLTEAQIRASAAFLATLRP